ncbi:MAG: 3-oxoacyl-[acyl-carrier-protein] reductase [Clostridiales bacterium]|jgi:3-oxoacyl-[acyl-carrier protein] reductase|nr:3-oxoacyl-[acyl-carrier-protein] reductase [Clostridiales bacterium]
MLQGKTALVTGASRGIGRAIALELAHQGADVAIVYAGNEQKARETQAQIQAMGRKAEIYCCNVADFDATKQLVDGVLEDFGGIDILVNNAGIVKDGMVLSMKEADFNQVIDTNLKGAFHMIKHTYSHFMRKRAGRIINITSVIGLSGNAGQANYASSKAGLIGLTKSVAKELGARGVTCNAVAPGYIATEMTDALSDKIKDAMKAAIPMRKPGDPEDVAKAVAFLASDSARYITGEVLRVDGGLAM